VGDIPRFTHQLAAAGFVAADLEAVRIVDRCADLGVADVDGVVARRVAGEPLEHILGRCWFAGIELEIDPGVFVPREETELLARRAVEVLGAHASIGDTVVDLYSGCGAVACFVASAVPAAEVVAVESAPGTVRCFEANAKRFGVRAVVAEATAFEAASLQGSVALVTAVPPYVPTRELEFLGRDALRYEPVGAFDGGADGLRWITVTIDAAARWLAAKGTLLVELSEPTAGRAVSFVEDRGFRARLHHDDDGLVRFLEATRP